MGALHVYATRPAPPDAPQPITRGHAVTCRRDGLDYWLVAAYEHQPAHALDALLFHAERRTLFWQGRGWADSYPPAGLGHELWRCDDRGQPHMTVARISADDTFTVASRFIELLAHRSLDAAVSTYTANTKVLTGREPERAPRLNRITQDGDHLVAAKGAPA